MLNPFAMRSTHDSRAKLGQYMSFVYVMTLLAMFACYLFRIVGDEKVGVDLRLRVAEATYFLRGINPYDVYVGKLARLEGIDVSHAYSFFSYYFAAIFIPIRNSYVQAILFSTLDVLLLCAGIWMVGRLTGLAVRVAAPLTVAILLLSVFFWQHINNLNYNFIAAFGLLLVFFGVSKKSPVLAAVGMIVIGLKPTLAIPAFIYLLVTKRWRTLLYASVSYGSLLMITSLQINTSPIDIIVQLANTQSKFSNGHTDGFFFFLKPILNGQITLLGIVVTVTLLILSRRYVIDPMNGLIVVIALGLSLFYNNVHAWIIVYPLLAYAIAIVATDGAKHRSVLIASLLLIIFLVVPRLAGLVGESYVDTYVAVHNVVRFSLLGVASFLLIRFRSQAAPTHAPKRGFEMV
jgi:hypothetical protein